jgi:hypothetical protein
LAIFAQTFFIHSGLLIKNIYLKFSKSKQFINKKGATAAITPFAMFFGYAFVNS